MTVARLADAVVGDFDPAPLLDRERELATLERCLADAGPGGGRIVVVEGPAGIGKSALLAAARDLAHGRGVRPLSARGTPLEQNFSYGAVRQLFEPLALAAGGPGSGELVTGAAALALPAFVDNPSSRLSTQDLSFSTLHGLYWLTANLAAREPLLLLVDDCHWVDAASLRFLTHLGTRLDGVATVVLVAVRSGDRSTASELLAGLRSLAHEVLNPSPLGSVAAARVVRRELGSASEEFCRACHSATGGNPLLLRELVASWVKDGAEPNVADAYQVAEFGAGHVARLLARRLALLPVGSDSFAGALAVLGDGSPLRHVAALAELEFEYAAELADGLRAASILAPSGELAFAHPIVRAAAEETLGNEQRALAHARAAELLADEGATPDRLALHLLHAHPRGDDRVVSTLRAASQVATGRGAPETAVTYLRRALEEPPAGASRAPVLLELGVAEMSARSDPRAVDDLREAVAMIDAPAERASAALRAGRALAAGAFFEQAAVILESVPDPDIRIEAELAASSFHLASRVNASLRRLERCQHLPIGPGWHFMQVMLAHRSLIAADPVSDTSALLDRALSGSELFNEPSVVPVFAAIDLVLIDRLDDAEQLCTRFIEEGQRRGARTVVSSFAIPRAFASLRGGRLRDAEADARWSFEGLLALVPRSESGPLLALAFLLDALTELGDFRGAEEALARADASEGEPPQLVAWAFVIEARGRLRVAQGRLREGLAELHDAGERWQRLSCPCPTAWREDAALVLVQLGEHDEARRLAAAQLEFARRTGLPRALGTATRAAGMVAPCSQRIPLLREAVDLLAQTGARLESAKALLELGAALRREGHRVEARDHLRQAFELAHRAAAAPLAARAREELLAAGGRPRRPVFTGVEALTASELRVARLAAKGLTNREIAESLYVTQRTVETHLRHAFQKLDIGRRGDLPAELTKRIPG